MLRSPVLSRVITLPTSEIARPVPAVRVTPVLPLVLLFIMEVVPVPAATVKEPSFVTARSPLLVMVVVPAVWDSVMPVPDCSVKLPPLLLRVLVYDVVPLWEYVCSSFVALRSPVFTRVMVFPTSEMERPVPASSVTPVLPLVLLFITDVVPVPAPTVKEPSFAGSVSTVTVPPPLLRVKLLVPVLRVCSSFVLLRSPVFARVMVFPTSEMERPVPASRVTPVEPLVLLFIMEVVPLPAATVKEPSFVVLRSPLFVMVVVPAVCARVMPVPDCRVKLPPLLLRVLVYDVVPLWEYVCSSFVALRSPVLVRVMVLPTSEMDRPVPASRVTPVEPLVLLFITDVVPVPAPTVKEPSFVALRSPVLVRVMVLPTSEMDRPVPAVRVTSVLPLVLLEITDVVPVPAPTVKEPSFVVLRSPLFVMVVVPAVCARVMPVPDCRVKLPPLLLRVLVYDVVPLWEYVCSSFVALRSPVLVRVMVLPTSEMDRPVPASRVTPVEPLVLLFITDVVPVPAATVKEPSFVALRSPLLVMVVVPAVWDSVMPVPDCRVKLPPLLLRVLVYDVVPLWEYVCSSFVSLRSPVLVTVKVWPTWETFMPVPATTVSSRAARSTVTTGTPSPVKEIPSTVPTSCKVSICWGALPAGSKTVCMLSSRLREIFRVSPTSKKVSMVCSSLYCEVSTAIMVSPFITIPGPATKIKGVPAHGHLMLSMYMARLS